MGLPQTERKTAMARKAKEITVRSWHRGQPHDWTGTVEDLRSNVFGYTLECGNSWNHKINRFPKTGKALVKALNQSVDETQGGCYERDYYELMS